MEEAIVRVRALEANENGEYSPSGLMVAHTAEDSLCINWMGVDSSRQNKGIGEKPL